MNLRELNKIGKREQTIIDTGYCVYICAKEKWKRGIYGGVKTNFYVSSLGRVYNIKKDKFVKLQENDSGYLYCHARFKGKRTSLMVNRLVLETFKGQPNKNMVNPQADHIKPNIKDNSLNNLQWLSMKENLDKRILSNQSESNNSNVKYTSSFILELANELMTGKYSVPELAEKYSIPVATVNNIKQKTRWTTLLKDYDFSNVKSKIPEKKTYTTEDIIRVADLLIQNESMKEISNKTGVSYDTVHLIKSKKCYKDILDGYDFSNYTGGKFLFTKAQLDIIDECLINEMNPREIINKLGIEYNIKNRNGIYDRKRKLKSTNK